MPTEVAPVGAGWFLRLPRGQTVSLAPAYQPVSRRFRPEPSTLLRPEHGLVPFLGREAVLDQVTGWCQDPAGRPVLLVTGGGGSGKTRLGREACVQMLVAGWDAGLADDQRRDGAATDRLQRPTLLVVDDADLRTGLIAALVEYLRWDDAGPQVGLLLLARAAGDWWDRLVRQQELADAYTVLDLDQHPVPLADRAEHFRRASAAFAAGHPGAVGGPAAGGRAGRPGVRRTAAHPYRRAAAHSGITRRPRGRKSWLKSVSLAKTSPRVSRGRRSGSGCCGRCVSGNGPAGMTWAPDRICPSTRTCRWPTKWSRWPR